MAGQLRPRPGPGLDLRTLLTESQTRQLDAGQAVEMAFTYRGRHRLRLNLYRVHTGLAAAIRILPRQAPSLEDLGLPDEVTRLTKVRDGLILFRGQTGAGKSTTLAAIAERLLSTSARLCITLESPVEYRLSAGTAGSSDSPARGGA